jgi:hypothetical protein
MEARGDLLPESGNCRFSIDDCRLKTMNSKLWELREGDRVGWPAGDQRPEHPAPRKALPAKDPIFKIQNPAAASVGRNRGGPISHAKQMIGGQILDPYLSDLDIANGFRGISATGQPGVTSSRSWNRDLYPLVQDKMIELSWYLYDRNPLAKRLINVMRDFLVGEGLAIHAEDPDVQEVIDDFWNDPQNSMDINLPEYVKELGIFGEQIFFVTRNPIDGRVRLWYIDPWEIFSVAYAQGEMAERSISFPIKVWLRQRSMDKEPTELICIHPDEDPDSETFGLQTGNCFYFAINKAKRGARGRSDIFAHADWLDVYEQMMFDMADRGKLEDSYIWDVLLKGMNAEEINQWVKDNGQPPLPNSVRAHNENVTWSAVAPDLKGADRSAFAKLFLTHIVGTAGYPAHWFGEGDRTNRATAQEMGWPTYKSLESRQRYFKYMLTSILNYVVDSAMAAGTISPDCDREFQVSTPDLAIRDTQAIAAAVQPVAQAVSLAIQEQLMTKETGVAVLDSVFTQLGVEVDAQAELEALKLQLSPDEVDYAGKKPGEPGHGKRDAGNGKGKNGKWPASGDGEIPGVGSTDGGQGTANNATEQATSGRAKSEAV